MNRADQAPEPSMEEILASIRSIIADDGKPSGGEGGRAPSGQPVTGGRAAVEEDVLDLTEELVFPEERQAPPTRPAQTAFEPQPQFHAPAQSAEPEHNAVSPSRETQAETQPAAAHAMTPMERVAAHLETPHPATEAESREPQPRPAQAAPRSIWSRRELPGAPAAPAHQPAPRVEAEPPVQRQQRRWAEDIHMPIPADGPVPLIPQEIHARGDEAAKPQAPAAEPELPVSTLGPIPGQDEATVAALAERLARSAVGAMGAEELTHAHDVDFEALHDERKAEVTESFATAIERESASAPAHPLPSLLDEVLRHDFRRDSDDDEDETEAHAAAETDLSHEAPAEADAVEDHAADEVIEVEETAVEVAQPVASDMFAAEEFSEIEEAQPEDLPSEEAQGDEPAPEEPHFEHQPFAAEEAQEPRRDFAPWLVASPAFEEQAEDTRFASEADHEPERAPETPQPEPALAHARFVGAEPSFAPAAAPQTPPPAPTHAAEVPASVAGPLEAALREMLRPMLVQWLNQNMPRILESAIREEIATRGLPLKSDDQV